MQSDSVYSELHKNVSVTLIVDDEWRSFKLPDEETLLPPELSITLENFDDITAEETNEVDLAEEFDKWNDLDMAHFVPKRD
ncbi:hypothetical protein SARC_12396 [Sphaeroforma arctica JP610]|uniref:Anaphase-promoting complex subunit 13 n=1 Tax=Sphaeroforma arctica JP610 TaxID=667725 RepID=A0A0L0FF52_9EUKA|nr:hypothetical protein SARC_12396 [Sphaeroforma arctica JP610]KNC75071.1 hypothetical protein SARC_12396 [Sphaeroforma arctica JP610]|eukprot:XP_014148973.1 hypothetical protein SARC_12396 [Sphaeroforma arctica JP610]